MTYDYELVLMNVSTNRNAAGDPVNVVTSERTVLCALASIGVKEFYEAAKHDMEPEIKFILNRYEYANEKYAEFENKTYRIIRTFTNRGKSRSMDEFETIELTCEEVKDYATT